MRRLFSYSKGQTVVLFALATMAVLGTVANEQVGRGQARQMGLQASDSGRRGSDRCELSSRKCCDHEHPGHCSCDEQMSSNQ